MLVAAGAAVNEKEGKASAALVLAAKYGHEDAILALLAAKANVNAAKVCRPIPSLGLGGSG